MKARCSDCKFWREGARIYRGSCHRYPPVPVFCGGSAGVRTEAPEVGGGEWCGEFQERHPVRTAYQGREG